MPVLTDNHRASSTCPPRQCPLPYGMPNSHSPDSMRCSGAISSNNRLPYLLPSKGRSPAPGYRFFRRNRPRSGWNNSAPSVRSTRADTWMSPDPRSNIRHFPGCPLHWHHHKPDRQKICPAQCHAPGSHSCRMRQTSENHIRNLPDL